MASAAKLQRGMRSAESARTLPVLLGVFECGPAEPDAAGPGLVVQQMDFNPAEPDADATRWKDLTHM